MSGFSPETRHHQIENQSHRCALLKLEVDILEGHHCIPKVRGGSNNPHNCISLAGEGAYCAYGVPVADIHERCDYLALKDVLFLHPDTLEFVTADKMPSDCFKSSKKEIIIEKIKKKKHKKKKH